MAKTIMIVGTGSNVGKSLICTGLCRIFKQDGYKVAPFKSQNMSLNSYITKEGHEIGVAQAVQAQAAGISPKACMNPILLKPTTDSGSQVIINGEVYGNLTACEYYKIKSRFVPDIVKSFNSLVEKYDIIVIEGAGSPAEINLNTDDFVNMGMAKLASSPVLLVGDIDKGGVFAQLYGTIFLLDKHEQKMIKGVIVNKFRGDITLFEDGQRMLSDITKRPVAGVIPYIDIDIDDEDSLSKRFTQAKKEAVIDIAVIQLSHISNFTDFAPLEAMKEVNLRYVQKASKLGKPDMIIIPGTKSTIYNMLKLRANGMEAAIKKLVSKGTFVFGICGGYQMLGMQITDINGAESTGSTGSTSSTSSISGMGLLPITTNFTDEKRKTQISGTVLPWNIMVSGYEIHMGKTTLINNATPFINFKNGEFDGCVSGNVFGTYLHGFFDSDECREYVYTMLGGKKHQKLCLKEYKEDNFNLLAKHLREHLDMKLIYKVLEEGI